MLLEVKSHGKTEMEVHAKNIYNLCHLVFRLASNKTVSVELWGRLEQRKIKYMGWHLLVLSNTRPDNSEWMLWDSKHHINEGRLVKILRFELDPNTLRSRELFKEVRVPIEVTATTAPPEPGNEIEHLKLNWRQLLREAPADVGRTPAAALLRSAKPKAIEENTVILSFKFPVHKENMEKPENQQIAEKTISNFLGRSCRVRCIYETEDNHLIIDAEEK